ncbi:MAG: low-specificity L-threonine aldolase [Gammaproteobacteria bacterium]|nr:low-specificity L-threonine aldolase [Gammaproteobacteria bacterium]
MRNIIDLRSDTLTQPCAGMREAMANAVVGDDVFGEDPAVNKLEAEAAARAGHQAGLFFPSGTQSNLVALMTHCQRGDEYIVGQNAHTYQYEGGGAAVLGSIQPQPIENHTDGSIPLQKIRSAIKPDDFHFARTRLLALENTTGGRVISQDYIRQASALAREHSLMLHLDGARVFNAAVAQGLGLDEITTLFDSVSMCLSKGLGAPVGSVLVGDREYIDEARHWRKMVGGGMRQAGVLAAAGLFALNQNVGRLKDDHEHARILADMLIDVEGLQIHGNGAHTNMIYLSQADGHGEKFRLWCKSQGLLFTGDSPARLVLHKDISRKMAARAAEIILQYYDQ